MKRSLQKYLRCIINGNDTKYTEWSTDAKLFPLAYNSQIATTFGLSAYEIVFNQKTRKPIMFTANSSKTHKFIANLQKNENVITYHYIHMMKINFITQKKIKLASGTHTEWIFNRDKKHNEIYQKISKKLLERQNLHSQINSKFTLATKM